ncbi:MAG: hypothetical protein AB7S78_05820 [Candidatus Omnitrophota bacterium]
MKNVIGVLALVLLFGCSYQGEDLETYLDDPKSLIRDPHYSNYEKKKDALESRYLRKEITYAVYLEETQKLDDIYSREVDERTKIIDSTYSTE